MHESFRILQYRGKEMVRSLADVLRGCRVGIVGEGWREVLVKKRWQEGL